jgi:hypothetical protein
MRSTWTDSRLDDLNDRFKDLSAKVSEMDTRLTGRIDSLQHTMIQVFIALMVAMFTGFIGLAGLILTQL